MGVLVGGHKEVLVTHVLVTHHVIVLLRCNYNTSAVPHLFEVTCRPSLQVPHHTTIRNHPRRK